jgi:hypothetical protein
MGQRIAVVYSVPLDDLLALPGSRKISHKKKLVRMIARDFVGRKDIDEMFEEYDPPNTLYSAVQQILNREPLLEDRGSLYGYAVEALCWAIGTTFFLPIGFPTVEYFDKFLERWSSPVNLASLVFSGFPLPIPNPECYPMAGCWKPEQVIAAWDFFSSLRMEQEDLIQVGIEEIRLWLAEAIKHETDALVGYYY